MREPIVGVLTSQQQIRNINLQKPNYRSSALAKANLKAKVTLYFFCLADLNTTTKRVIGSYYDERRELWVRGEFPYPQVLYLRGFSNTANDERYDKFQEQLTALGVQKINSGSAFDKWEVLEILKAKAELLPHLPPTITYESSDDLLEMLNKYRQVYLKARRGSKGKQVIRVEKLSRDLFSYRYFRHDRLKRRKANFKVLQTEVEKFFRQRPFIIQKAIDLPYVERSIYDMRAEVQRNGKGELEIVAILVRVSQPDSPITQHAASYLFEHFFSSIVNWSPSELVTLKARVEGLLVEIYTAIEEVYGPYGEIGIDLALDKTGQLWFFETNSQPAKVSLAKAAKAETIEKAFLNPLEFAKFIYRIKKNNS